MSLVAYKEIPFRTVNQVVDNVGTPAIATATSNIWVGREGVFSNPTEGNKIQAFTTGAAYFSDIVDAINAATNEICIIGWQVSWDALLKPPSTRLYDVLLDAAKRGVKICVMPWDDTNPVQTYDDQTKAVLESINKHPEVSGSPVAVMLAKSLAKKNNSYFSHHQKQVIIDRKIAYVGGIDLCYGRYDDATYDLHADKDGREVMNRYNGCIAWVGDLRNDDPRLVDPDYLTGTWDRAVQVPFLIKSNRAETLERISAKSWQVPYQQAGMLDTAANKQSFDSNKADYHTLDPACQPRMPWQDIHARIEGPAVSDLLRNFVRRWNAHGGARLAMPKPPESYDKLGKAGIQVLRSAPQAMVQAELKAMNKNETALTENDIGGAMVQLIEKAHRFIYIENQFFVSAFGELGGPQDEGLSPAAQFIDQQNGGDQNATAKKLKYLDANYHFVGTDDSHAPPRNQVCAALIKRIETAILDKAKPKFHVYITLPVHSEGTLSTASIAVQVYWTMQTLVFGSHSLLNGVRRALKARELLDKGEPNFRRPIDDAKNTEHEDIPLEKCFEYVTLLNLRNWAKLGSGQDERFVTEQIYVHSKLMIVDDLYALFGSANINDRSLLGERDSEIAVLVVDGDSSRADINGKGSNRPVRNFAHNLRIDIWKKLFGITGNVRPAQDLLSAIEAPGIPDSWRRIQRQAEANAAIYEAAFPWVPRNWSKHVDRAGNHLPASILPVWNPTATAPLDSTWGKYGNIDSPLPFQPVFWEKPRHAPQGVGKLASLQGFITALPIHWTEQENIRFEYPTAIVVMNDNSPTNHPQIEGSQVASIDDLAIATEEG